MGDDDRRGIFIKRVLITSGAALVAVSMFADRLGLGSDVGMGVNQVVVVIAGLTFVALGFVATRSLKKVLLPFVMVAGTYLVFEVMVSILYLTGAIGPSQSAWYYEDSGRTIHFDAIRGFRLTQIPSRVVRFTDGEIEYVGVLKGNNQGFADRDDFYPERERGAEKRLAVFGDSFTAAQFLKINWPDHVEGLARDRGDTVQLLNFSVDGGGLANWWSVLTQMVEPQEYEIDGVIFAVYSGDLRRRFSISDHRDQSRHMFARVPMWDPDAYPKTLEDARRFLRPLNGRIVSTEVFEKLLSGEEASEAPRPLRPYFAWSLWQVAGKLGANGSVQAKAPPEGDLGGEPGRLVQDMRRFLSVMDVPVLVVHLPSREELLQGRPTADPDYAKGTREFAALLDARFVDGANAFDGGGEEYVREMWLPIDGHWGQKGSNRFAMFMAEILKDWP